MGETVPVIKILNARTPLVVHWLRIRLPMQGDSGSIPGGRTGETKSMHHNKDPTRLINKYFKNY